MPSRKPSLPLFESLERRPTLEVARTRLGGKANASGRAGAIVRAGVDVGIVIHAEGDELDVLVSEAKVRRAREDMIEPATEGDVDSTLLAEVRIFLELREGQRVRFMEKTGAEGVGLLVEKCRYGALVAKDDGKILAVGFRKLWPVPSALA